MKVYEWVLVDILKTLSEKPIDRADFSDRQFVSRLLVKLFQHRIYLVQETVLRLTKLLLKHFAQLLCRLMLSSLDLLYHFYDGREVPIIVRGAGTRLDDLAKFVLDKPRSFIKFLSHFHVIN